ncbi:MAG: GtrA family protein [Armatimonadetes bacterium]|nr:GtrA family protein [Anaerolineae bacterium]
MTTPNTTLTDTPDTETNTKPSFRNPLDIPITFVAKRIGGSKSKEIERFLRFAVVGVTGAMIDIGLVYVLQATRLPPINQLNVALVNIIAFTCAVISNFIWTRMWVYPESRSKSVRRQLVQFAFISVVGGVGRTTWVMATHMAAGVLLLPLALPFIQLVRRNYVPGPLASQKLGSLASMLVAMVFVMLWNFFANRYWTYNDVT